ncbi:MAG TPA: energy transducer TonB [Hyphomonadaceae bacterium]|jgi:protein TonB|nr:energy transducer TonB [Hyphomonadaceae bacterium]HPN07058.1 energy transducer TonB [Hyphomonadaceae bacterium]
MYYATKRNNTQTRVIGLAVVVLVNVGAAIAVMNGFGTTFFTPPAETEVVMIEEPEVVEEEVEPPPPIDVELPPPPPQVILPDFVFETPPPQEAALTQVQATPNPAPPPPVQAKPAPPPPVTLKSRPKPGRRFEKPEYPSAALRAGEQGEVVVSVCVDKDGRMSDVKLVKSSGSQRLDDATIKGLPRTRLDPAIGTDGKPIAMCNPPYQFTLVWDLQEAKR